MADVTLDVSGEACPMPVIKTKETLEKMESGETLEVTMDYPASKENIQRFATHGGHEVLKVSEQGEVIKILIKKV